jgi:hypothetical protein
MNKSTFSIFAVICTSMVGCAAPDQAPSESDESIGSTSLQLSKEVCQERKDECSKSNPLFGWFTCPAVYEQCIRTPEVVDEVGGEIAKDIAAARKCNEDFIDCQGDASGVEERLACVADRAECIAEIVQANLPPIVTGTAECVEAAAGCIADASRPSELLACGEDLTGCAVNEAASAAGQAAEVVGEVIEEAVGPVLTDVNECREAYVGCVDAANNAAELAACGTKNAVCVADALGLDAAADLASSAADAAQCAQEATECTFDSRTGRELGGCADDLQECLGDVVEDSAVLSCTQKFNKCMAENPLFGVFVCFAEAQSCQD